MPDPPPHFIVAVDIEASGQHPQHHSLLALGAVVLDTRTMRVVDDFQ